MAPSLRELVRNPLPETLSSYPASIPLTIVVGLVVCAGILLWVPGNARLFNNNSAGPKKEAEARSADPKKGKGEDVADDDAFVVPPVRIKDSVHARDGDDANGSAVVAGTTPFVLTTDMAQQVAEHVLPTELADYTWIRVYSLSRDGDSFVTFLKSVENLDFTLVVLRTQKGSVVGAFADASWTKAATGPTKFYGGPKCRLFRVLAQGEEPAAKPKVECYKWTGANLYCQLCDVRRRRIAFGGGSSGTGDKSTSFGLTLERDFLEGTTAPCPTFDNPPLCEESFAILELEVFGFRLW